MKLFGTAWMIWLASMGGYLLALMVTAALLGKASGATAERAAMGLLAADVAIFVASIVWFASRSAVASGQPRYGWVIAFGLWQLAILAAAGLVSLVALNR